MPLSDYHISIILLAAGRGVRMKQEDKGTSKLLLPLAGGQSIVRRAAEGALRLGPEELIVVVRPDLPAITQALSGLAARCVPNPRFAEGMGTSLAVGARSLGESTEAVLVMLGDEPAVAPGIVQAIVDAYLLERKPITTSLYGDEPGPPTLFARALFAELSSLEGDAGGRQLILRHPEMVCRVALPASTRPHDIDTPDDYQRMRRIVRDA